MLETLDLEAPTRHGTVRVRIHRPARGELPGLVYLHGGGWTLFSIDTHDRLMREYAARTGCCVIGVDYALSPESRFPVPLEQAVDVVRWLVEQGRELGIDANRLAIGGDSAGANLSVATCLVRRDPESGPPLCGMVLNYGAFLSQCSPEACRRYGGPEYMLGCEEMSGYWRNYMRNDEDAEDPLACPLLASLEGLPPAFLAIAECDISCGAERRDGASIAGRGRADAQCRIFRRVAQFRRGDVDRRGQRPGHRGRLQVAHARFSTGRTGVCRPRHGLNATVCDPAASAQDAAGTRLISKGDFAMNARHGLIFLVGTAMTGPVLAQDQGTAAGEELGAVVVTAERYVSTEGSVASKSDIPLVEMPQSVSVVSRDMIDLLNWTSLNEAVRYSAGATGEAFGPDERYDWLQVRGFDPVQFIDGVQAPIGSVNNTGTDLYGSESVEVLKGPASVLYGQSPPGGIVNMTSRRPQDVFGGELEVQGGEYNMWQVAGDLTGPLAERTSGRVTALYRDRETQVDFLTSKRLFISPAVTFKFNEDTRPDVARQLPGR